MGRLVALRVEWYLNQLLCWASSLLQSLEVLPFLVAVAVLLLLLVHFVSAPLPALFVVAAAADYSASLHPVVFLVVFPVAWWFLKQLDSGPAGEVQ